MINYVTIQTSSLDYYIEIVETPVAKTLVLYYQPPADEALPIPLSHWFHDDFDDEKLLLNRGFLYYTKCGVQNQAELLSLALTRASYYVDTMVKSNEIWEIYYEEMTDESNVEYI